VAVRARAVIVGAVVTRLGRLVVARPVGSLSPGAEVALGEDGDVPGARAPS
jgi:hypothetical protein